MTNVSKHMLFAFLVAVSATMLSLGAFATTVHADDWYDAGSFDGGSWYDAGSYGGDFYDAGSYDSGWYDSGSYGGDWYETSSNDWYDAGSYNPGWYETDTYNPGYDVADSYNPGYYETDSYNPGYYETDSYNPGYYETDSYNPGYYDVDSYDAYYVDSYMDQYASGYTGGGSYGGSSFGGGFSFPGFSSTGGCTSCHTQIPPPPVCTRNCVPPPPGCTHNCYPTPTPVPTCTTCGGSNITNVNTNVNTNTNTYIDNSINDSFNTNISNSGNTTILAPVVPQHPVVYQPQVAAPYCVITLTNAGQYSAQASLVWSSSNATSAYISQIGAVAPNGTRYVTGYANQIYSLTVTGQGGTYTCQTQMYTPTYVPPVITPSVSLEQIPYTGLALGPVAQMIYWLSLFSVAAAGAYLVVYYKGGALALMGASMTRKQNHFVVSEQEADEVSAPAVTEVAEEVIATPVADLFNALPTMAETKTRDVMQVIRNASGVPQIVISRA